MGVARISIHTSVFIAMQSLSESFRDGKIALSGYVPVCGVGLPDFSMESLRHIPGAIVNYVGSLSMAYCALLAASKMVHSWYHCRFDEVIGGDGHVAE